VARQESVEQPHALSLREELRARALRRHGGFGLGDLTVEVASGQDSLWAIVRRPGRGGIALRLAHAPGGIATCRRVRQRTGDRIAFTAESVLGRHGIRFATDGLDLQRLRVTMSLTPTTSIAMPFSPHDLYPLDEKDDPLGAKGAVKSVWHRELAVATGTEWHANPGQNRSARFAVSTVLSKQRGLAPYE
jgi:hypothetical protein